jgi:hypothetical protein
MTIMADRLGGAVISSAEDECRGHPNDHAGEREPN